MGPGLRPIPVTFAGLVFGGAAKATSCRNSRT